MLKIIGMLLFSTLAYADSSLSDYNVGLLKENGILHVDADEAQQLLDGVQVLDVRTAGEFQEGHIADAINIDYYADNFKAQLDQLDKQTTYLVHCQSGGRSGKTLGIMQDLGFEQIIHLDGGPDQSLLTDR